MAIDLPPAAFVALAALSWADGDVRPSEHDGLLAAAKAAGLEGDHLDEVEAALADKVELSSFEPAGMTEWQRAITYAIACWLARLDGVQSTDESDLLRELARRLELSEPVATRASIAAFDVYCLPEGGRPERFDFVALSSKLHDKLPALGAPKG
jgi:tellurite resistance protein